MNLSSYDNVESPVRSCEVSQDIQLVLSDVMNIIKTGDLVSYCPFCIISFADDNSLEKHLKIVHIPFLYELLTRSISLDKCSFCPAKFFSHHLVARHALTFHCYVLFETFFKKARGGINCLFCPLVFDKCFMTKHITSLHSLEFNEWFVGKFCVKSGSVAGIVELPGENQPMTSHSMEIDALNEQFIEMKVLSSEKPKRSILKNKNDGAKSKSDRNLSKNKLPVCRQLRFEEDKESLQTPRCLRPRRTSADLSKRVSRSERSGSVISWTTAIKNCIFQCGKCSVCFSHHAQLVIHVKKEHKKLSLNVLQPFYQCALCNARFYKSSYLKKHSALHSLTKFR